MELYQMMETSDERRDFLLPFTYLLSPSTLIAAFLLAGCTHWIYYQNGKSALDVQQDQSECENRIQTLPEEGRKVKVFPTDVQITECMNEKGYSYIKAPRTQ